MSDDDDQSDDEDDDAENEEEEEEEEEEGSESDQDDDDDLEGLDPEGYDAPKEDDSTQKRVRGPKKNKIKALTPEELEKFEKARKKTGVCYLSRIPLFMKPSQVRNLLEKHAELGRIFLVPEDAKITFRRKKYTKNRRTNFVEGWVEFKDKKKAKSLAEYLNMRQIGGKRKSPYYSEMWNIKYLPKFKWQHLTEQMGKRKEENNRYNSYLPSCFIAHENQARQQRLRNEIAQANRENKTYIQNVEKAKMLENMEEKKRKRNNNANADDNEIKVKRMFSQRAKVNREVDPTRSGKQSLDNLKNSNLKGVLGSIFSKK
jgi:ESF2/ABP1 family protein